MNPGDEGTVLKQLVQTLRGDLNILSNEAKKKFPAVREVGRVTIVCEIDARRERNVHTVCRTILTW